VYTFSQGKLKIVTNKQYTTIKNNYELTFDQNSEIKPCQDTADIKAYSFNFVPIDHLVNIEPNHMVDLIGQWWSVLLSVHPTVTLVSVYSPSHPVSAPRSPSKSL
jgi:hypothetical protein